MKKSNLILFTTILLLLAGCKSEGPGTLKWKYKTNGPIESSPAIGYDGTVYITSMDSCLYAFAPEGNLKWKYQFKAVIYASPAVGDDGTIYINPWDSYTYAITSDGKLKWKCETWFSPASPAIGNDGTVYIVAEDGHFYAITPEGKLKWHSKIKLVSAGEAWFPPVIGLDGTLYAPVDNFIYAVDTLGNLEWSYEIPSLLFPVTNSSIAITSEGDICFSTSCFHALSPLGKSKVELNGLQKVITSKWSSPVIGADGTLYFGGMSFYVLNPDYTLKARLEEIQYGRFESTTTIGFDGTLYVGTNKWEDVKSTKQHEVGYLSAATPEGKLKWRYKVGGGIKSSPAIGSDGTIYFGSRDSCVYAIRSDSKGLARSSWPKFQHDNQNTGRADGGI